MGLTVGQAIGIGIVVGFVGALVLVLCIPPTPSVQVVKDGEPAHTFTEIPQHLQQMMRREADPRIDSVRWFSRRMHTLASVQQIAEVVEFEDFISSFTETCIDALRLESLRTDRGPEDSIERSITGILERSANSALHLLAQPSEWEAAWVANEPGFIVFPEIRLVWNGYTKFSKPAVVDADTVWPIPSDDNEQADDKQTDDKQHPEVDAPEQPKPETEKLSSLEDGHSVTPEAGQEPCPTAAK
ncbi:hypothetical protein B0J15DRAFT_590933 [Fusarium solani]|uniref:Uncharacterized protein n=1 Tax=Fusarium solani TaxID=169388 RepID=A0A9P9R9M9_FUSSL|nr:uncharacterized protein B0J15DRAFT_590933 [Fusarium solani]KAH7270922.1 hypothetical protein B0J15DRAFT_590933 [Fusarium solani]